MGVVVYYGVRIVFNSEQELRNLEDDPLRNLRCVAQAGLDSYWVQDALEGRDQHLLFIGTQIGVFEPSLAIARSLYDEEWETLTKRTRRILKALGYVEAPGLHLQWDP